MRRTSLFIITFMLCALASATRLHAGDGDPYAPAENDGVFCQDMTGNWVQCSSLDSSSNGTSGIYYYCTAKGSWGGSCAACGQSSQGTKICVTVSYSAAC